MPSSPQPLTIRRSRKSTRPVFAAFRLNDLQLAVMLIALAVGMYMGGRLIGWWS